MPGVRTKAKAQLAERMLEKRIEMHRVKLAQLQDEGADLLDPTGKYLIETGKGYKVPYQRRRCRTKSCPEDGKFFILRREQKEYSQGRSGFQIFWDDALVEHCPYCGREYWVAYAGPMPKDWKPESRISPKDASRQVVYDWERHYLADKGGKSPVTLVTMQKPDGAGYEPILLATHMVKKLTAEECQKLVNDIHALFGWSPPKVKCTGKPGRFCRGSRHQITLVDWGQCVWVVLHEAAHSVSQFVFDGCFNPVGEPAHGASFMAIYLALVGWYCADRVLLPVEGTREMLFGLLYDLVRNRALPTGRKPKCHDPAVLWKKMEEKRGDHKLANDPLPIDAREA